MWRWLGKGTKGWLPCVVVATIKVAKRNRKERLTMVIAKETHIQPASTTTAHNQYRRITHWCVLCASSDGVFFFGLLPQLPSQQRFAGLLEMLLNV